MERISTAESVKDESEWKLDENAMFNLQLNSQTNQILSE
jgi:hypothetical protein